MGQAVNKTRLFRPCPLALLKPSLITPAAASICMSLLCGQLAEALKHVLPLSESQPALTHMWHSTYQR